MATREKDFYVGSIATQYGKEHFASRIGGGFITLCGRAVPSPVIHGAVSTDFGVFTNEREALAYFQGARPGTTCGRCATRVGWQVTTLNIDKIGHHHG